MATWHMIVSDISGNAIGELTNATQRQFMFFLQDTSSVSFQMNAMDDQASMVDELDTDCLLYRDKELLYRGRFGATTDTLGSPGGLAAGGEPGQHTVLFSAVDYRGMLAYRIVPDPDVVYTNVDQSTIAWDMISASETRLPGAFGITQGATPASVQRTFTATAGSIVGANVDAISQLDAGFDWNIDSQLRFNTWPVPSKGAYNELGRGNAQGITLVYGDNVMAAQRTLDATKYANLIRYTGGTPTDTSGNTLPALVSNVNIVTNALYEESFTIRGRWEAIDSDTNIMDQSTNDAAALGDLVIRAAGIPAYTLTLTMGWWDPDILWLGDLVNVIINHGRIDENFIGRVSEIDIYLGDDADEESVIVTVGPRMGSLLRRISTEERKHLQIAKKV
jgi:hypothetical protein